MDKFEVAKMYQFHYFQYSYESLENPHEELGNQILDNIYEYSYTS